MNGCRADFSPDRSGTRGEKTVDNPSKVYYNVDNKKRRVSAPGKDLNTMEKMRVAVIGCG